MNSNEPQFTWRKSCNEFCERKHSFSLLFLRLVCVYGKWKMLIAWILQLMNWLSCSQVVVDFSSIHNNLSRRRDRPTDCMSGRPSDRQPNQCFYFSFVRKHTHTHFAVSSLVRILLIFSTAID